MFSILKQLRQSWTDWCGDREMEQSIRSHLSANGYFGGTAKFQSVRLAAVQRPGWLQVYRFEVTARVAEPDEADVDHDRPASTGQASYHHLFGLVREDARSSDTSIRVFRSGDERRELFTRWSEGLIVARNGRSI